MHSFSLQPPKRPVGASSVPRRPARVAGAAGGTVGGKKPVVAPGKGRGSAATQKGCTELHAPSRHFYVNQFSL